MSPPTSALDFAGKRVLVGGGGGAGMGAAAVDLLVGLGAEVYVFDLTEPGIEVAGYRRTDLGEKADIAAAVASIAAPIDVLLNCQGVSNKAAPETIMRVNFLGVRELTEQVLAHMAAGSAIVTVASAGGLGWQGRLDMITQVVRTSDFEAGLEWVASNPDAGLGYALSKECVVVWSMRRAVELAARAIRINCTSPGATESPMKAQFREASVDFMVKPAGRPASTEEQAWPLLFLASRAAGYINGANLIVDGGNAAGQATGLIKPPA